MLGPQRADGSQSLSGPDSGQWPFDCCFFPGAGAAATAESLGFGGLRGEEAKLDVRHSQLEKLSML